MTKELGAMGRATAAGLWTALLTALRADLRRAVLNILVCGGNQKARLWIMRK